jgi:hypothetical protein
VEYGTSQGLGNTESNSTRVTNHSLTLIELSPNTTYYFRVTSVDLANNSATFPEPPADPATFTTPSAVFIDTTAADFHAGTPDSCYVSDTAGGEVVIAPIVGTEFDGHFTLSVGPKKSGLREVVVQPSLLVVS